MRTYFSRLLILLLALCLLTGCGDAKPDQTQPPNGPSAVGDTLSVPEATISLSAVTDITIHTAVTYDGQPSTTGTYAYSRVGDVERYYKKFVFSEGQQEFLCTMTDKDTVTYRSMDGGTFQLTPDSATDPVSDRDEFRADFAYRGFDYAASLSVNSLKKKEDATVRDIPCYVYDLAYTDLYGDDYTSVIYVDKATGIWMKEETTMDGAAYVSEVTAITYTSTVIPGSKPVAMEEQTVYDQNGITITAKALSFADPNYAATLQLETTNTTTSNIRVYTHYFDVNGLCLAQKAFDYQCPAGEMVTTDATLSNASFQMSAIEIIQSMEMALAIENCHTEQSVDGNYTVTDSAVVAYSEPITLTTACPDSYEQPVNTSGEVLIDTDDVQFTFQSIVLNTDGSATFKAYCQNHFAEPIRVQVNLLEINGQPYDDFEKARMPGNSEGYTGFTIYRYDLEDLHLEKLTSVKLSCQVFYGENVANSTCLVEETVPVELTLS